MTFVIGSGDNGAKVMSTTALPSPQGPRLSTSWMQNAINHFMHHFVLQSADGLSGIHDGLPTLYMQDPGTTCLYSTVQAIAMANYARVNNMGPEYLSWARRLYGGAVHALRTALDDITERASATTLMTTELLSEYDVRVFTSIQQQTVEVVNVANKYTYRSSWEMTYLLYQAHTNRECYISSGRGFLVAQGSPSV